MIPKRLHFTFSTKELPNFYRDNLDRWKEVCPEWRLYFYTDADIYTFFKSHFPIYHKELPKIPFGVVLADCFRYAALFVHGGLYSDIDTFPLKRIPEEWLNYESVLGYEYQPSKFPEMFRPIRGQREDICQWTLLGKAGGALYKQALDESFHRLKQVNYRLKTVSDILNATGPFMMSEIVKSYQDREGLLLLDADYFGCCAEKNFPTTDRSVIYHQYHGADRWMMEVKLPHLDFGYRKRSS